MYLRTSREIARGSKRELNSRPTCKHVCPAGQGPGRREGKPGGGRDSVSWCSCLLVGGFCEPRGFTSRELDRTPLKV